MFSLQDYAYELPEALIAQKPVASRADSRLLVLNRDTGERSHRRFSSLPDLLRPSDTLVVNNTEVIPGRLVGKKDTGGRAEVLILDYAERSGDLRDRGRWSGHCLVKSSKRPKNGSAIYFEAGLTATIDDVKDDVYAVSFDCEAPFEDVIYRIGKVPLPPYIKRNSNDAASWDDRSSYQTVYASQKGAIAAPTAGLHFTRQILEKIRSRGVDIVEITLHVGYGTFLPVRVEDIREHRMHAERFSLSAAAARTLNRSRAEGRRIVAVGTTCVRTLEYALNDTGGFAAGSGSCDLFIYPGYAFRSVGAMLTNFHLPCSTLLMLVSAFAGRRTILDTYEEAIRQRYRFFSYGDAMLIE